MSDKCPVCEGVGVKDPYDDKNSWWGTYKKCPACPMWQQVKEDMHVQSISIPRGAIGLFYTRADVV